MVNGQEIDAENSMFHDDKGMYLCRSLLQFFRVKGIDNYV